MNEKNEANLCNEHACSEHTNNRMSVATFFRGKNVFLTGGTGFLGKVLIDKLLRDLHVDTVYMLVREKKGEGIHSRVDAVADNPYFEKLKQADPKFKHRIVPIKGDCFLAGLGCSLTDIQTLVENVDIVIHCAATVRFDERLDIAFAINVSGTRGVVQLCHQMKRLKAFLHMSTAYANCHMEHIDERFYEYSRSADEVGAQLGKMSTEEVVARTADLIRGWPNTYSFTKALAESVVRQEAATLPAAVFRPAIVLSTLRGAVPGWTDNLYGPVSGTASSYAGFTRVCHIGEDHSCNVVPVDKVVDGALAATWEVGTRPPPAPSADTAQHIKIYNYVSSNTPNEITWSEYNMLCTFYGRRYPIANCFRDVSCTNAASRLTYYAYCLFCHFIPALIVDLCLLLSGNKPRLFSLYRKAFRMMSSVLFFVRHSWTFADDNVRALYASMTCADRRLLPMSMRDLNWKAYLETYLMGIRKYLIKDDEASIEAARRRFALIRTLNGIARHLLLFFGAKFVYDTMCNMVAALILGY